MLKHGIWHKELNYENYTMKSCFHDKKNYMYINLFMKFQKLQTKLLN